IDAIPITDHVARRLSPRECLRDLACDPVRGRMGCDVDPDEVSAGQPDDDEGIEQVEANGRNNEQIQGCDVRRMVTQEGAPALTRWITSRDHVFATVDSVAQTRASRAPPDPPRRRER